MSSPNHKELAAGIMQAIGNASRAIRGSMFLGSDAQNIALALHQLEQAQAAAKAVSELVWPEPKDELK